MQRADFVTRRKTITVTKKHPNSLKNLEIGRNILKSIDQSGEKNPNWGGEKVGYSGVHKWLYKHLGKPSFCEGCGTEEAKKFEWANISGEYKRDLEDWIRLCKKCHFKFDDIAKYLRPAHLKARIGVPLSAKHKRNLSLSLKGKKYNLSPEQRKAKAKYLLKNIKDLKRGYHGRFIKSL